jgi:hypothetical protein
MTDDPTTERRRFGLYETGVGKVVSLDEVGGMPETDAGGLPGNAQK